MAKVIYECGCKAGGDLISPYCSVHTNMPIVKEIDNSTTKKQEKNIMTTENKETEFDRREIRPMIQFVDETTESKLKNAREQMIFTRAKNTIRRTGWYFTESYSPCGEYMTTEEIKASIADVFGA